MLTMPDHARSVRPGGGFQAQFHMGGVVKAHEVSMVNELMAEYGKHVLAYLLVQPTPSCYSLELQFDASKAGQAALKACQAEYESRITTRKRSKSLACS